MLSSDHGDGVASDRYIRLPDRRHSHRGPAADSLPYIQWRSGIAEEGDPKSGKRRICKNRNAEGDGTVVSGRQPGKGRMGGFYQGGGPRR